MNKILFLSFLFFYSAVFSQGKDNPFNASENETFSTSQNQFASADPAVDEDTQNFGPPGEDDTVPIDDYIPLLFLVAIGMIVVIHYRKTIKHQDH